jgi:hypothetical protein
MAYNPLNPQPPFAEPGKQRPDCEIARPGHYRFARDADPEPLPDEQDKADYQPYRQPV